MEQSIQSANITSPCLMCGARAEKMHRPMFHRGSFCPRCCPVCAQTDHTSAAAPPPTTTGIVPRPAKPAAQGASQWKDGGWEPHADAPFYHDRERHETQPRWVPRRPHWFR
jgi:hypothetical protein